MTKKKKIDIPNRFAKLRKRLHILKHPDVEVKYNDIIMLKRSKIPGAPPGVICTCGWEWIPEGDNVRFVELGQKAKEHAADTGHALRPHPTRGTGT